MSSDVLTPKLEKESEENSVDLREADPGLRRGVATTLDVRLTGWQLTGSSAPLLVVNMEPSTGR